MGKFVKSAVLNELHNISEIYRLNINAHDAGVELPYDYDASGVINLHTNEPSLKITSLKINEMDYTDRITTDRAQGCFTVKYEIALSGHRCYRVERRSCRMITLGQDPVMSLTTRRFAKGLRLRVDTGKTGLSANLNQFGDFSLKSVPGMAGIFEWQTGDLLFPRDGLTLYFCKQ